MKDKLMAFWQYIQALADVNGDTIMLAFSIVAMYKILHGGLNMSDSAAYSSAIAAFAYSNTGRPKNG